jgi:hypothetical protein
MCSESGSKNKSFYETKIFFLFLIAVLTFASGFMGDWVKIPFYDRERDCVKSQARAIEFDYLWFLIINVESKLSTELTP